MSRTGLDDGRGAHRSAGGPRRVRVESGIYRRADGKLEILFRDASGVQRGRKVDGGIAAARRALTEAKAQRARREPVAADPRLRFGAAADRFLDEQVSGLSDNTSKAAESYVRNHLKPRWGGRRMDSIDVSDAARLVRDLRAAGYAEWTISGITGVASRVFKFARRHCGWHGENPFVLLESGERAKVSETAERRIYESDELAQVIAASTEPWRALFRLASVVGGRESELLGLWWEDLGLGDLDMATIRFTHQVDRAGQRVKLKTPESRAVLPLPRATAVMMLEHRMRSTFTGPKAYVFATATGRPIGQRNALRALYRAQERARDDEGRPTFPELFETDERGNLVANATGAFVPCGKPRKELPPLPDFHALRHTAAMDCDDAEEARDLLRHRNSNVTRQIYRSHFTDKRREALRARMEARQGASPVAAPVAAPDVVQDRESVTDAAADPAPLRAVGDGLS